jgi:hypothetical protein
VQLNQDLPLPAASAAPPGRCPGAHVLDPRPCEGAADAVQIVDQTGAGIAACVLHGSVLLASLDRARVYPLGGPEGCAIIMYVRAWTLPPFDFLTGPGVARVTTAEEATVFPGGSDTDDRDSRGWDA